MDSKLMSIFLIFLMSIQSLTFVEGTECYYSNSYNNYKRQSKYVCDMRQDYSDHRIGFMGGRHLPRQYDNDVQVISHSYGLKDIVLGTFTTTYCDRFKNLENITFVDAKIAHLSPTGFRSCVKLEILNLDYNEIREIPENLLAENRHLKSFYISSNQLTTLHENTFKAQHELRRLDLSVNRINHLPRNVFKQLTKLDTLSLGSNQLTTLDHAWFQPLKNLATLHFYANGISELPRNIFSYNNKLWILALEFNKLSEIRRNSFGNLQDLERVYLNNNQISAIDGDFIDSLGSIREIDMRSNLCSSNNRYNTTIYNLKNNLWNCVQQYRPVDEYRRRIPSRARNY